MATILCVDSDAGALQVLRHILAKLGHRPISATDARSAFSLMETDSIDLVILEYRLPDATAPEFLERLPDRRRTAPVIVLTGEIGIEYAVASMKAGALDYLGKPIREERLRLAVDQVLALTSLRRGNDRLAEVARQRQSHRIVGNSSSIRQLRERVQIVARSRVTVLVHGESGTGKELVARAIHEASDWAHGPFISVNCAALPEALVESSLFGHEKGAFTGAVRQVKGAFERAHHGTLLLDEVSEMRIDLQAKLLRVLQEKEFERVGGTSPVRVKVRVIATTNRDLVTAVREGRFREDLYYRLNVVQVRVPPLRARMEDLEELAEHFLRLASSEAGREMEGISEEAMALLASHSWPGNVRELAHAIERAVILEPSLRIGPEAIDLVPLLRSSANRSVAENSLTSGPGSLNIAEMEEHLIEKALRAAQHNRTRAAGLLGISVRTLRNKLNRPDKVAMA